MRPTGLILRRDGTFVHEGVRVTHRRLHRALLRGVRFLEEEGVFVVQLGRYRGRIDVEDTPFWVRAYDSDAGEVWLTDESREPLEPETLSVDPDGVLRCRVKRRFPARFTHAGQAHLLDALDLGPDGWTLRVGSGWRRVAGLPVPSDPAPAG